MAMKVSYKLTINKETERRLGNVAKDRMHEAVNELRNVTLETLSGSRSGRAAYVPGTKKIYTASAPGEAPAQATGRLRQSIKGLVKGGKRIIGVVGTDIDYGPMLEYGTRNMAARPWLSVATEKATGKIRQIFRRKWM